MSHQFDIDLDAREPGPLYQPPRYFQRASVLAIHRARQEGCNRMAVVLPTGTGKTRCMSLLAEVGYRRILCVANSVEVANQIAGSFMRNAPHLKVGFEQADRFADHGEDVVVATVQTIGNKRNAERLARVIASDFEVVILDEVQHSTCETSLRVLRAAGIGEANAPLLAGYTATFFRADKKSLFTVFERVVYQRSLGEMIEEGWLCNFRVYRVLTDTDISDVPVSKGGDFNEEKLALRINTDERNNRICSALKQHAKDRKSVLIFAANVAHAKSIVLAMRDEKFGFQVEMVTAKTEERVRRKILDDFDAGRLWALVNVGIVTEGVDFPRIDCVVLGRMTKSPVLAAQIRGRGLRPFPGKPDLLILDIVDLHASVETVGPTDDLGVALDLQGRTYLEAAAVVERVKAAGLPVDDVETLEQLEARERAMLGLSQGVREVKTVLEAVELFGSGRPMDQVLGFSKYSWLKLHDAHYTIGTPDNRLNLRRDEVGCWHLQDRGNLHAIVGHGERPDFKSADSIAKKVMGAKYAKLKELDSLWRFREINDSTRGKLRSLGVHEPPPWCKSAGHASDLIGLIEAQREEGAR